MRLWSNMARRSAVWYYMFCFLGGVTTLALMGWAAQVLWAFPYEGLKWSSQTGQIVSVDPFGPAAQAGIEKGDRLSSLDGRPVSQGYDGYPTKLPGDVISLELQRSGEQRDALITLAAASPRLRAERLEPLVVGLAFWLVGMIAWGLRPFHDVTRLFFVVSQTAAATLAAGSLSTTLLPLAIRLFGVLLLLLAPLTLHFCSSFPEPLSPSGRRWILRVVYGISGLLVLFYLWASRPPNNPAGPNYLWTVRYAIVALSLSISLVLLLRSRGTGDITTRRRRRLLIAGMIISLFPLLFFSFLPSTLKLSVRVEYIWTFPFLILLPISFAYAVQHGELGRVDFFLNRSLVYALLTMLLLGLSLLLSNGINTIVLSDSWKQIVLNAGIVLLLAALMNTARGILQRWVDRLFYGGWYDYRSVVRKMCQELSSTLDLDRLVQGLLTTARTMRFGAAALLWKEKGALVSRGSFGYVPEELASLCRQAESRPFPDSYTRGQVVRRVILPAGPPEGLANEHKSRGEDVQCWLLLISREELHGVLVLGRRQGGEELDAQDQDLLSTVAAQAAIAAENVLLLETLREQLAELRLAQSEVAEVRRRLSEGREAERQYLARELHDGPIQDLEGMRLWLGAWSQPTDADTDSTSPMFQDRLLKVIDGLRAICRDLRPAALVPFGLAAALRSDIERFREAHPELEVQLDLVSDGQMLSAEMRLALYRIYREAISNIERHARASQILVRLHLGEQRVSLEIRDNGRGFALPARWVLLARQGHLGLLGATERAEILGGQLEVISAPGQGTTVRAQVPLDGLKERVSVEG